MKLTLCVVSLVGSELMIARSFGLLDTHEEVVMAGRANLCESIAVGFSLHAMKNDISTMHQHLAGVKARNEQIRSLAVRTQDGKVVAEVGDHSNHWIPPADGRSNGSQMVVPISSKAGRWGAVEVQYGIESATIWQTVVSWIRDSFVGLIAFMTVMSLAIFSLFFSKVLKELNPAKVIPGRVRNALDTLTEGLLVIDAEGKVVLANESFSQMVDREPDQLLGAIAIQLPWYEHTQTEWSQIKNPPWEVAITSKQPCTGRTLDFRIGEEEWLTFVVNASPIFDGEGNVQGVLTSLEDVTQLERNKLELKTAYDQLQIHSEQLERLATTDPLTECLNRRSFFERFDKQWADAVRYDVPIAAIMVDIDFFKSINDNFGHSMGDEVLRGISATLRAAARTGDIVCRFGGEEFCIMLSHSDIDQAAEAAERFRAAIAATQFSELSVTASLGVSARNLGGEDPQGMIDQADRCLYVAKRNGRNQVVRWDDVPDDLEVDESQISRTQHVEELPNNMVPYRAVAALLSTLSYRHPPTAAHSRRTADLCVIAADGLLSPRQSYALEIAALLHDIGKMGVPDSILLKSEPLNAEEWGVMFHHDHIGVDIVRASFDCEPVSEIVACYRMHFAGSGNRVDARSGRDIPVGARILAIADAYDSMTVDSSYRHGMSGEEAFAELRKCAGTQFDPDFVELFIGRVQDRQKAPAAEITDMSRDTALDIGSQIERLIDAVESQDVDSMKNTAHRLRDVAAESGLHQFAAKASEVEQSIEANEDILAVLDSANDLIQLCRSTHSTWLHNDVQTTANAVD